MEHNFVPIPFHFVSLQQTINQLFALRLPVGYSKSDWVCSNRSRQALDTLSFMTYVKLPNVALMSDGMV